MQWKPVLKQAAVVVAAVVSPFVGAAVLAPVSAAVPPGTCGTGALVERTDVTQCRYGAAALQQPGATVFVVPAGVTSIDVQAWDGSGGAGPFTTETRAPGATVDTTLSVTPGETLHLSTGDAGLACGRTGSGGGDGVPALGLHTSCSGRNGDGIGGQAYLDAGGGGGGSVGPAGLTTYGVSTQGPTSGIVISFATPTTEPAPVRCEPGFFSSTGNAPCTPAPLGTFVDTPGATAPTPCPPGTTTDATASISCHLQTDTLAPTVTFTPASASYGLFSPVSITCHAADEVGGSGLAVDPCPSVNARLAVSAPAWTFGPGTTTTTARATDNRGNAAEATMAFTVRATAGDLCTLTGQMVRGSAAYGRAGAFGRRVVDATVQLGCASLAAIRPTTAPATKKALTDAYAAVVRGLSAAGYLTTNQVGVLTGFAATL